MAGVDGPSSSGGATVVASLARPGRPGRPPAAAGLHMWAQRGACLLFAVVAAAALALGWGTSSATGKGSTAWAAERQLGGDAAAASGCAPDHAPEGSMDGLLAFLFFGFVACNVLDHVSGMLPQTVRPPLSVLMLSAGYLLGSLIVNLGIGGDADEPSNVLVEGIYSAAYLDPHAVLYIILPPLLFESASGMTWHVLRKVLASSLILAIPGVLLNAFLTGAFVKLSVRVDKADGHSLTWPEANLLASILSATDPVAVVASLTSLGAPPKLSTLVEGESLLNDGSAVVLFKVFFDWSMSAGAPDTLKYCPGSSPEVSCILEFFMRMAVGGAALGVLAGMLLMAWVSMARSSNSEMLEVSLILSTVYATFFVAEKLTTSGVLAVVALGFTMTYSIRVRQSHDGRHSTHTVLQQIGYHCNQVAFFGAGIICARYTGHATGCMHDFTRGTAWLELGALYVAIHLSRAVVVLASAPFLLRLGYGLSLKEATVLVWGGLRGAVGLILALQVEHSEWLDASVKQMIVFHVSGIVLLTLFVNAVTIDNLYTWLNPYPVHSLRRVNLEKMLGKAEKECQRSISHMFSQDWFFKTLVEGEEEVTELAKVLPCVPNFCSLGFNAAGEPFPVGICMVSETLASLRTSAKTFQAKEKSGTATDTTESFRRSFTRSKASEDSIRLIAEKNSTELCAVTDDISANVSVDSTGHVDFIIDPEHPTLSNHGAYISSKSLLTITQEQTQGGIEPTGFGVKILATSCVKTIVGFVADTREVRPAKTLSQAAQAASIDMFLDEELGAASGSIGLDCLGGVVRFRCPGGSGSVEVPGGPVQAGEHVLATLQRKAGGAWEVVFEMRSRAKGVRPAARCVFGTFSAAELYPCVQLVAVPPRAPSAQLGWAPGRALLRVKVVSAWGLHGAGHGLRSHRSGLFGNSGVSDPYYCVCELRGGHASRAAFKTKVVPNGLRPVWDAECGFGGYLPEEWLVFTVMRKHSHSSSTVGHAAIHSVDFLPHGFHGELLLRDPFDPARQEAFINVAIEASDSHDDMEAILTGVSGRWEPQADTGFEASADIGLEASPSQTLGSGDGQRLSGRARLALNFEPMNGATAEGIGQMFHVLFNHMMHMYSEKHEHGLLSDLALYWLTESVLRGVDCANHEVNALSSVDLGKHSRNDIGAEVSTMYEPLVVEYLSLENMIVDEALWWDVVRFQAGQHEVVRAKVEALCAFVEAHVSIRDNAVTGRYPQFVKFIDQVILKAKNNMQRICDLQPDRWYFAKHTLALRFILRNRLDKLRGMVAAGLLTARDVGVLEKDLRMRLAETELYNGSYRRACSRWCARRCRASTWSNVWDYAGAGRPVA